MKPENIRRIFNLTITLVCFGAGQGMAQSTWSGAAGVNWNHFSSWDILPSDGSSLIFSGSPANNVTNNDFSTDPAPLTIGAITFGNDGLASTTAFTLGGNAVATSVAFPAAAIATTAIAEGGAPITDTISLPVTLGAGTLILNQTNHNLTVSGVISGANFLSKGGAGVLTLSGANTYTGITYLDSGTLKLGAADVIPGEIRVKRGNDAGQTNGILDLNGFSDSVSGLSMGQSAEEATANSAGQTPSVINSSTTAATLSLAGNFTYNAGSAGFPNGQATISADLALSGTGTQFFNVGDGSAAVDLIISGVLSGTVGFEKEGEGTLQLSNAGNLHSGPNYIRVGKLILGNSEVLGNGSTLQIGTNNSAGAAMLDLNGFAETVGAIALGATTMNPDALGGLTYSIVNTGDSAGFLKMNGNLTYNAGPADKQHGQASISANIDLNGGNRTFTINNNTAVAEDIVISGNIGNNTGTAGLSKAQAGVLVLSGNNTYNGTTTVSGGVLLINGADALPTTSNLTLSGGVIGLGTGNFTRALGTGAGEVNFTTSGSGFAAYGADRIVNLGGASAPLTWVSGGFFTTGTGLALSASTATHTVDFQNPINLGPAGGRQFSVADGAAAVDAILSGAITMTTLGASSISKNGTGTLKLSNSGNAYTGNTNIDAGTLMLGAAGVIPDGSNVVAKRNKTTGIADPVFDLNGYNETIKGLSLGGKSTEVALLTSGQKPSVISSGGAATLTVSETINYYSGSTDFPCDQATISANLATGTTANRNINVEDGSAAEDLVISGALTGGSITKLLGGTLALSNAQYSGNTTVSAGTLTLSAANPNNDASTVTVAAGALLNLTYTGTDKVKVLIISGTTLPDGVYGKADAPGIIGNAQITGDGTITVFSDPYEAWAGVGVPFDADANNDGVSNGLAWLLGATNKDVSALDKLPVPTQSGGGLQMTFSMLNAASRGTATVQLQHSSDLGITDSWALVTVPEANGTVLDVTFTVTPSGNMNTVTLSIPSTEAAAGKLFGRLKGTK